MRLTQLRARTAQGPGHDSDPGAGGSGTARHIAGHPGDAGRHGKKSGAGQQPPAKGGERARGSIHLGAEVQDEQQHKRKAPSL